MDTENAIRWTLDAVAGLAALPPPSPQHPDDMGFSGVTDAPLREYLERVSLLGPDQTPIDQHFAAVSYLREHSRTQLSRPIWEEAFKALRDAWMKKLSGLDAKGGGQGASAATSFGGAKANESDEVAEIDLAALKGRETATPEERAARLTLRITGDPLKGNAGREGSWFVKMPEGIGLQWARRRKYALSNTELEKAGLRKGTDFRWAKDPAGTWTMFAKPPALGKLADLMQEGWPLLAAAIRMHLPAWEGLFPAGAAGTAAADGPPWTGTAEAGRSRDTARWEWSANDPDTLQLLLPKDAAFAVTAPSQPMYRTVENGREFWRGFRTEDVDALAVDVERTGLLPFLVAAMKHFKATWQTRVEVDSEAVKRAKNLVRRFKYMVHPDVRKDEDALATAFAKVAPLLQKIKPGDTAVDLGAYGKWRIVDDHGVPVPNGTPLTGSEELRVYMPFALKDWGMGLRHARKRQDSLGWHDQIPVKRSPEAARKLDLTSSPLALSLRIALLTETLRECYELEEMAGAVSLADIADAAVRKEAERLVEAAYAVIPQGLRMYPYQEVGVAFAAMTDYRCLIGDAPGLGKTIQALACLNLDTDKLTPTLIVAPSSVAYNWVRETARWAPGLNAKVINSSTDLRNVKPGEVHVISWGALSNLYERLARVGYKCIVLDESHYAKNPKAARTKSAIQLAHSMTHRMLLSGTAMENRPEELWAQLHMIAPEVFPDAKDFKARFGSTTKRRVGKVDYFDDRALLGDPEDDERPGGVEAGGGGSAALVLAELRETLRCFMVRRLKQEVLKDLPAKTRQYLWNPLPPDMQQAYDQVAAQMESWLCTMWRRKALREAVAKVRAAEKARRLKLEAAGTSFIDERVTDDELQDIVTALNEGSKSVAEAAGMAIVALGHLRRIVGEAKAAVAVDWIRDFLEQTNDPLVVFVEHQKPLQILREGLDADGVAWTYIDGAVPPKQRAERVADFQAGKYRVFVGTRAMAEGVTLTRASDGLFIERWWVPSKEEQAEDRLHRIGQEEAVLWRYLMAPDTVDVDIAELVDAKREIIEAVMRGEDIDETSTGTSAVASNENLVSGLLRKMLIESGGCTISVNEVRKALEGDFPPEPPAPGRRGDGADDVIDAEEGVDFVAEDEAAAADQEVQAILPDVRGVRGDLDGFRAWVRQMASDTAAVVKYPSIDFGALSRMIDRPDAEPALRSLMALMR